MTDIDTDSERALWCAVIQQAIDDAAGNSLTGIARKSPNATLTKERARKWLLGNSGDFLAVCELAGIEPRHVREHARKAIVDADNQPDPSLTTPLPLEPPRFHAQYVH